MDWIKTLFNKFISIFKEDDFVYEYQMKNFGQITSIHKNWIFIERNMWAPGLWTGAAGATIKIKDRKYMILDVDHTRSALKLSPKPSEVNPLDVIDPEFFNA